LSGCAAVACSGVALLKISARRYDLDSHLWERQQD
jgi:hypothetical protein